MKFIEDEIFDEERALYGENGVILRRCRFEGPADGESALKESASIRAEECFFNLRYPFWHDKDVIIEGCELTGLCRAALWYSEGIEIKNTKLHGIKALRECARVRIEGSEIISPEFGWSSRWVSMKDTTAESEYFFMRAENLRFENVHFKGKYSFQYIENAVFENCVFDTKDAFWHAKNVTVRNSIVKGEYLAWYSEGLTLVNCKISGTQPLCCCNGLRLENCELTEADLCFEKSEVEAEITTSVISVKNPKSGTITLPEVGEVIMDDENAHGIVNILGKSR